VAIQVKSGTSYKRHGGYAITATAADVVLWAASTVPVFGLVHDPSEGRICWTNLTAWARTQRIGSGGTAVVSSIWSLSAQTLPQFVREARDFMSATGPPALVGLADRNPDVQLAAVFDAFALGRRDARALLLLRASLRYLRDRQPLRAAIHVLALCVGHGDIFWHAGNWIDDSIRAQVRSELTWSYDELVQLLSAADAEEYARGGRGEDIAAVIGNATGPDAPSRLEDVAIHAPHEAAWPALMLLVSDAAEDGLALFNRLVPQSSTLRSEPHVVELGVVLSEFGYAWLWG
jgi:hypothetical protein